MVIVASHIRSLASFNQLLPYSYPRVRVAVRYDQETFFRPRAGFRLLLSLLGSGKKNRQKLTTQLTDMIPEGESIKPDDEDLDNTEGDEIPAPDHENQK
jgi:hypothetical protein